MWEIFREYSGSKPIRITNVDIRPNRTTITYSWKFWTLSLSCFNIYREWFYDDNGVKFVPKHIGEHLSPLVLAYWFMDDGYRVSNGFYFCTESFTAVDNIL